MLSKQKDTKSSIAIIDFQQIYYRYKNALAYSENMKRMTWGERDVSMIFYPIRDICVKAMDHGLKIAVCFDSYSDKKSSELGQAMGYKSGRKKTLFDDDYGNIAEIMNVLKAMGVCVYKIDGFEADDLINHLVQTYKMSSKIDVYTNDYDLVTLVDVNVNVNVHGQGGYKEITMDTYEEIMTKKNKARTPYNTIKAFKCLVGDPSDGIPGVKKFGAKSFDKWINSFDDGYDYTKLNDMGILQMEIARLLNDEDKIKQALDCASLVEFMNVNIPMLQIKNAISQQSLSVLLNYGMKSTYDKMLQAQQKYERDEQVEQFEQTVQAEKVEQMMLDI